MWWKYKMSKSKVQNNTIFYMLYQIILVTVSIISVPYIAKILGENGVGKYSFAYTTNSYWVIFASLGFNIFARREIAKHRDNLVEKSKVFYEIILCRLTGVVLVLAVNFILLFSGVYGSYSNLILIFVLDILSVAIDISFFFYGNEEFGKVIFINLLVKIFSVLGIFIFVKDPNDTWVLVLLNSLVAICTNLCLFFFLKKNLVKVKLKDLKPYRHLKKALILFIPTLALSVYNLCDNFFLGIIVQSDAENGFYAQAEKIVKDIIVFINCVSIVMLPHNSSEVIRGNINRVKENNYKAMHFIWLLGMPVVCGLFFVAGNFIPWFLGENFHKSILLLQLMSVLILLIALSTVLGEQYLLPNKNDKQYVWAILIGVFLSFIINIPLIYWFGSVGAVVTMIISEFVILLVMLCMVAKKLSLKRIFGSSLKPLVASVAMCLVIGPLSSYLAPSFFNTLLIIAVGFVIYLLAILVVRDRLVANFLQDIKHAFLKKQFNYEYAYKFLSINVGNQELFIQLSYSKNTRKLIYTAKSNILFQDEFGDWRHAVGVGVSEQEALAKCYQEIKDYMQCDFDSTPKEVPMTQSVVYALKNQNIVLNLKKFEDGYLLLSRNGNLNLNTDDIIKTVAVNKKKFVQHSEEEYDKEIFDSNEFNQRFETLIKKYQVNC